MSTTTHDEAAFFRAICERPEDDLPRLVYADWLDDTAGTVECPVCPPGEDCEPHPADIPCDRCGGSRRVPDHLHDLAEFVRVQVELVALDCHHAAPTLWCKACTRRPVLQRRERELFNGHKLRWFDERQAIYFLGSEAEDADGQYPDLTVAVVRRGFVDALRVPLAAVVAACVRCRNGLIPSPDDEPNRCEYCSGTGHVPGPAAAVVRSQPVTSLVITDRSPYESRFADQAWIWFEDDGGLVRNAESVPRCLFDLLPGGPVPPSNPPRAHKHFPTPAAAAAALSAAAVAYLRG